MMYDFRRCINLILVTHFFHLVFTTSALLALPNEKIDLHTPKQATPETQNNMFCQRELYWDHPPWVDAVLIWCDNGPSDSYPTEEYYDIINEYPEHVRTEAQELIGTVVENVSNVDKYFFEELYRDSYDDEGSIMQTIGNNFGGPDATWTNKRCILSGAEDEPTRHYGLGLDIVTHEYMHGMVESIVPGWDNPSGMSEEARALSEGYCDIFSCMIDFKYDDDGGDWTIGENTGYSIDRSLENPTQYSDGRECFNDWKDGDWHANSTIFSRTAYILSEGGEFTGCDGEDYFVNPFLDPDLVALIYYFSLFVLEGPNSTFCDAWSSLCSAANNVDPVNAEDWYLAIDQAFAIIGVNTFGILPTECDYYCWIDDVGLYPWIDLNRTESGDNWISIRMTGADGPPEEHMLGYSTEDPAGDYESWFDSETTRVRWFPEIDVSGDVFDVRVPLTDLAPEQDYYIVLAQRDPDPEHPTWPDWDYTQRIVTSTESHSPLLNYSFEIERDQDYFPLGWHTNGAFPISMDTSKTHNGNYSVKINKNENNNWHAYLGQEISVNYGEKYSISGFVTTACAEDPNCYGTIMTECLDQNMDPIWADCDLTLHQDDITEVRNDEDWVQVSFEVKVDNTNAHYMRVLCFNSPFTYLNAIGSVWCDSIEVTMIESHPNGGDGCGKLKCYQQENVGQ